jgi:hypothetical protein
MNDERHDVINGELEAQSLFMLQQNATSGPGCWLLL